MPRPGRQIILILEKNIYFGPRAKRAQNQEIVIVTPRNLGETLEAQLNSNVKRIVKRPFALGRCLCRTFIVFHVFLVSAKLMLLSFYLANIHV